MKTFQKKFLVVSITVNVLFALLFLSLCIYKRNAIAGRLEKIFAKSQSSRQPSEAVLSTFNQKPYMFVNEFEQFSDDAPTISLLILGNSLTYTGVPEEESDKTPRGLTATKKENDYAHLLVKRISEEKKANVAFSLTNIADFERHFTEAEMDFSRFSNATARNPDYVIFQIGENVSQDDITNHADLFEERYSNLASHFKDAVKIICLPWWPDARKNAVITKVAINSHSYLVDISHLGSGDDKLNYASSYKDYKQPGVGIHPSDYGMRNIADCLWTVFNAER